MPPSREADLAWASRVRSEPSRRKKQRRVAERFRSYFATVRPVPFPDDMTTKNVYVHEGAFTGIEDVDYVCHGG